MYKPFISNALRYGPTWPVCNKWITQFYLPPAHEPYLPFTPQPQGVTAVRLVLIAPTHEGMARLS